MKELTSKLKITTCLRPQTAESKPPGALPPKTDHFLDPRPDAIRTSALRLPRQPSNLVGLYKEFISSPRIDNQLSTWGAIQVWRPRRALSRFFSWFLQRLEE